MELENSNYTLEELHIVLGYFSIDTASFHVKTLTAGYINDTFLVSKNDRPLYILQRINHTVFADIDGLMQNVSSALKVLNARDYIQIKLVSTPSGQYHIKVMNGYWRLMTFIPNSTTFNTTTKATIAFEAGRIVGKFHDLLQHEKPSAYADTIPRFHDLSYRSAAFNSALENAHSSKLEIAQEDISYARTTLQKLKAIEVDKLKVRICHNDTKLNNILFSKKTNKALSLIDLDTIMKGYFFYDFGDAVRTIVNTAPEDEQDHSKITFCLDLFEAFVKGLSDNSSFLSKEELKSLPLGTVFMPFIHGLRALTDYLNNNRYYKVSYENQNLDRCRSLFSFSEKAWGNQKEIQRILASHFPALQA
jgi:Ser/Thr protein kinase RdoA (MazF antagonist)